jgi:hypothetical protein
LAARHPCGERRSARRRNGSGEDRPRCRRVRACRRDRTRSSSRGRCLPELRSNPPQHNPPNRRSSTRPQPPPTPIKTWERPKQEWHRQHHRSMRPWVLKRLLETPRATPSRRDHPPREHRWRRLHRVRRHFVRRSLIIMKSGEHVAAAIAMGARAIFIGRPALWALAAAGQEGAQQVIKSLTDELAHVRSSSALPASMMRTSDLLSM